jgi:hypothetical protein
MNISGFIMHEQNSFVNITHRLCALIARLQSFYVKLNSRKTAPSVEDLQQDVEQNQQKPSWNGQVAHIKMRMFKLNYFGGIPADKISKMIRKIHVQHLNLQYAGLAVLTIPALMQLATQQLMQDPNILPSDPIYTSSIPPSPDFWATGWKTNYGRALQTFSVEAPETSGLILNYKARSHVSGLREDILSWRKSNAAQLPHALMIVQKDMPPRGYDTPNIHMEITKRSKAMDLSLTKTSVLSTIPSKFGPVEVLDVTFADKTKNQHSCVAFRTQAMQPNLKLSGWLCGEAANAIERPQVTCFINRLDILGAKQDTSIHKIFQNAESQRGNCTSRATYTQDNTKKGGNWLEIKSQIPSLKGVLTAK